MPRGGGAFEHRQPPLTINYVIPEYAPLTDPGPADDKLRLRWLIWQLRGVNEARGQMDTVRGVQGLASDQLGFGPYL